ncbi:MAG: hypothetical protein JKY94_11075, partial [Rhodobacteraceae bacterium]|nr:hypothetical protein [Paracoccaceae bacterium]
NVAWYWGGSKGKKVIVPPSMRADLFDEVIDSLRDEDFAALDLQPADPSGAPYSASDFHDATPVATKGGYVFAKGDPAGDSPQWIRGEDGKPFVMNIETMREQLGQRVPGAWR